MPAPMIVAPDLPVAERLVETGDTVGPGADEAGGGDPAPIRAVPVRRAPEVRQPAVRRPAPAAPPRPPTPGATADAPTHEPTITRRLFHGLRRRS